MSSVRSAEMDETIRSARCWNETKPPTLGTCLEQRAAPGAKMSLYHRNWRILQILFATITTVLTQGKWPSSNWLIVVLYLNQNCPSGMSRSRRRWINQKPIGILSIHPVSTLYLLITAEHHWATRREYSSCAHVTDGRWAFTQQCYTSSKTAFSRSLNNI